MSHSRGGLRRGTIQRGRGAPRPGLAREVRTAPPALGPVISRKTLDDIDVGSSAGRAEITDVQLVASYNLLEGLSKEIIVPGRPPAWTHSADATISPDTGTYYRDDNAARFPDHPMDPAVASIILLNPFFDASKIHVFGCGSTLGDLLRFALEKPQPFTFIAHVIGKTVFFVRRNHSPEEIIDNVYGYGHTYPETNTTWRRDVKGSYSHQRILKYTFGGLNFLVRFEADGYVLGQDEDLGNDAQEDSKVVGNAESLLDQALPDSLNNILGANFTGTTSTSTKLRQVGPTIRTGGTLVSQASIFDLKTRSTFKQREEVMSEQIPRLWVRQIPNFILAFHTKGKFEKPKVQDVKGDLDKWERESATALEKMAGLIQYIRDLALAAEDGKLEVRGDESSTLQICTLSHAEKDKWNPLSDIRRAQWILNLDDSK